MSLARPPQLLRAGRAPGRALRSGAGSRAAASSSSVATAPLTKDALVQFLRSGCKPPERWRCVSCARARTDGADAPPPSLHSIGTEHEKFGFRKLDKRPIDYTEVKHLLEGLVRR